MANNCAVCCRKSSDQGTQLLCGCGDENNCCVDGLGNSLCSSSSQPDLVLAHTSPETLGRDSVNQMAEREEGGVAESQPSRLL